MKFVRLDHAPRPILPEASSMHVIPVTSSINITRVTVDQFWGRSILQHTMHLVYLFAQSREVFFRNVGSSKHEYSRGSLKLLFAFQPLFLWCTLDLSSRFLPCAFEEHACTRAVRSLSKLKETFLSSSRATLVCPVPCLSKIAAHTLS